MREGVGGGAQGGLRFESRGEGWLRGHGGGVGRGVSGGRAGSRLGGRDAAGGGGSRSVESSLRRLHGGTGCERERERGFDFPGEGSSEV